MKMYHDLIFWPQPAPLVFFLKIVCRHEMISHFSSQGATEDGSISYWIYLFKQYLLTGFHGDDQRAAEYADRRVEAFRAMASAVEMRDFELVQNWVTT